MNRSAKRFTIIAGIYLFLLTFMLLTQPRSGYPPTLRKVLFHYSGYVPLWAFTALVIYVAAKNSKRTWSKLVFGKRTLFCLIMLILVIGYALGIGYYGQTGCFGFEEKMFSGTKSVLSIISVLLLSAGFYFTDSKLGVALLIIEFIVWTMKSLYFNTSLDYLFAGYFTMSSWILRFALIFKTLNEHTTDSDLQHVNTGQSN